RSDRAVRKAFCVGQPVFQDDGGHARIIESAGDLVTLMVDGEPGISAAGTDDHRGRRRRAVFWEIDHDAGQGDPGYDPEPVAVDAFPFLCRAALEAWRFFIIEVDH